MRFNNWTRALALALGVGALTGVALAAPVSDPTIRAAAPFFAAPKLEVPAIAVNPTAPRVADVRPGALDCLAAAVYYEARGESVQGRAAVAQVVLNRTRRAGYPKSVCAVVYQRRAGACQFSFVCNGAMQARREPAAWRDARRVAARALAGRVMTAVGHATCFRAVRGQTPRGAVRLGAHVFTT